MGRHLRLIDPIIWHDNQAGVLLGLYDQEDADLATKHGYSLAGRVRLHLKRLAMTPEERRQDEERQRSML